MESHTYYNKTDNFSKQLVFSLLNKRGKWEPSDNKKVDLCIIGGYYRTCTTARECFNKLYSQSCKNAVISADIPPTVSDYLFKRKYIKLSDKAQLFKSIIKNFGERNYLPLTYNINLSNLSKYRNVFDGNKMFFLKPNEGFERQGQIKTKDYEVVLKQLKKFKNFKNWQLQEFIESYTKEESFLRAVIVTVIKDGKMSVYVSQINEWGSIKYKDGTINMFTGDFKFTKDGCQTIVPKKKGEYTGKNGLAHEIYDKLLGEGYYKKHITPQINKLIKEAFLSLKDLDCRSKKNKLCYHISAADLMIDKNLDVKLLEINIYPTHFVSPFLDCVSKEVLAKAYYSKTSLNKALKYEEKLLDEIFSVTVDKIFKTERKVELKVLKKVL